MKKYEQVWSISLPRRMPLIIRLDGKAFHTLTAKMKKPFDVMFSDCMLGTTIKVLDEAAGAVFAYVQSDEISILFHNYKKLTTEPWFDNSLQKLVSITAGIASARMTSYLGGLNTKQEMAVFDSRTFVLSEAEVNNYFLWRQQDATRNSVQMLARSLYSHKECHKKNNADLQEMIHQKGHNWSKLETRWKRGVSIIRENGSWRINWETPVFSKEPFYIKDLLEVEEE